ncbi:MAG TPA: beta-propeller fold lactonase family protein [Chthoniobacterales bacterium]|nr:beta-propeller fold lactonase family protein [Chthoniobacterales bacterium]
MKSKPFIFTGAVAAALALAGSMTVFAAPASPPNHAEGAVYAMTNALQNNQVKVFTRMSDGTLVPSQTISTGGGGSGTQLDPTDSLGSQGALVLDQSHKHLFAVNTETLQADPVGGAGVHDCQTGTVSVFRVENDGRLTLTDRVSSGGLFPASLAVDANRLYVLNAGGPGLAPACGIGPNITGFKVAGNGRLTALAGSTRAINPGSSPGSFLSCDPGGFPTPQFDCGQNPPSFPRSPARIGFTPDGDSLVVTVKSTNSIYVFPLNGHGHTPGTPAIWQASGPNQPTYFGFSFDSQGHLIVAEPFGTSPTIPAAPASAVSSFAIDRHTGALTPISQGVANGRGTSCWVAVDPLTMRHAFTSNNNTSDISSYRIGSDGSLTLLAATAATANLVNDLAVATGKDNGDDEGGCGCGGKDSAFLYSLNAGDGTVGAWRINCDASLTSLGTTGGLPADAGAQGLAAY